MANPPGHIGLISENHPGTTEEIESGCEEGGVPFWSSFPDLLTDKSEAKAEELSEAMRW